MCCPHNTRRKAGLPKRKPGRPKKRTQRAITFTREARKTKSYSAFASPTQTPKRSSPPKYSKILEFFGFEKGATDNLCKHLPPRNLRESAQFWLANEYQDPAHVNMRLSVMRFYREILLCVAEALCGLDGAADSVENFSVWLNPDPTSLRHGDAALSCLRAIAAAKKGSMERRFIRATLCGAFKLKDLDFLAIDVPGGKIGHSTYAKSRHDFDTLLKDGALPAQTWSRSKFDAAAVDGAIRRILAYENVAYLSWGTKRIRLHGVSHDIPSILRKKPIQVMFDEYVSRCGDHPLSRASFYLSSTLTSGEMKPRKSVDYVTEFLVNDTFDTLADICDRVILDQSVLPKAKPDVVKAWLKYGHARNHNAEESIDCPRHDVSYGLTEPEASRLDYRPVTCDQCVSLNRFFSHLARLVSAREGDPSAVQVIEEVRHKIDLFMGHRLRVVNQQREIAKMIQEAEDECLIRGCSSLAVILIDFKMKAEPMYFREKTADHYGNRGMKWHGAQVRSWEVEEDVASSARRVREVTLYYDQLSRTDNKQDKGAVLSLLEVTMMALRRDLPHVSRVIFQNDNSSCYQNACVIVMLPIIGAVHGIKVERYEHTETHDGKSPSDDHFGQASRKVYRYVKQGLNCVSPSQYVAALASNGGLPNCVAELVEYDRLAVTQLLDEIVPMEAAFSKLAGRANDVLYQYPEQLTVMSEKFVLVNCPDFSVRVFAYSGIGDGISVCVSPQMKTCIRENAAADANKPLGEAYVSTDTSDDDALCVGGNW